MGKGTEAVEIAAVLLVSLESEAKKLGLETGVERTQLAVAVHAVVAFEVVLVTGVGDV